MNKYFQEEFTVDEKDIIIPSSTEETVSSDTAAPVVKKTRTRKKSAAQLNKQTDSDSVVSSEEKTENEEIELTPEAVAEPTLSSAQQVTPLADGIETSLSTDDEVFSVTYTETETDSEGYPENYSFSSFFAISSSGFQSSYSETADEIEVSVTKTQVEDDDPITPPDELFSKKAERTENVLEQKEEISESVTEEVYQYDLSDLIDEETEEEEEYKEPKIEPYNPEKPRKIDGRFDFVELFIFTLLAVMILTSFFFRHTMVKGVSMENTLQEGDHLIISGLFYTPKRGDIIVCEDYSTSIRKPIVKRVIAVGGDTVRITKIGEVYVNDELIDESSYVCIDGIYTVIPLELTVPDGELFVMGDHRNDSKDSRDIGTISEDSVLGRVLIRFYPFDKFGIVK